MDEVAPSAARPAGLRFALQISSFPWGQDPRSWLASVATAAERAGFAGIAVMDHLLQIPQVGRAWDPIPEAYVTLGYLAGVTERIELGALVTPVTFRSAPLLAKILASLDAVSGGRVFCGIGAGWFEREHAGYGLPFPSARARLDALETDHRGAQGVLGPRHQTVRRAPGNHLLPPARPRSRSSSAAAANDAPWRSPPASPTVATCRPRCRSSTTSSRSCAAMPNEPVARSTSCG